MQNQPISKQDAELRRRLRCASTKARFWGLGFILFGVMLLTLGYFLNTPSQQQFDERVDSGNNLGPTANKVIDNVAPLAAGRALSSPLMMLMPFVFMGLGLLSIGGGIKEIAKGASSEERQDIGEEFRIEQLIHARQNNNEMSPNATVDGSLRFDGIYVLAKESEFEWKYLIFYKSGRVRIPSTSLTPVRAFVEERRKDSSDSSTYGWSVANYKLIGSTVSFSVPPTPKECGQELTGSIEENRLRLKIEYFSESSKNLLTPKTVEYSFFPIPIE